MRSGRQGDENIKNVRVLISAGDRCGEAIVWSADESAIYWTDVTRFLIHRMNVDTREYQEWHFDQPVVAISLTTRPDTFLVALGSGLILWNRITDCRTEFGPRMVDWPGERLNDGRSDPLGNFWVGSMANNVNSDGSVTATEEVQGKLLQVMPCGQASVWREAVGIANTVCWSPDRKYFYFGDSLANIIYRYVFDIESGAISNGEPFFTGFSRGAPDGSAVDSEGFLWNCRFGGGCIARVAPSGELDRVVEMPVQNPTTCTFGGVNLQTLYVTSAEIFTDPADRLAGSVFELNLDARGTPEHRFRLG